MQGKDAVTREQIINWYRLSGMDDQLTESRIAMLGDFAIFARAAPSPEAPAVDALTTGAGADPMDVLLERLKSGGDYTAPLYTTNQGNEPKVLTRERLAVLVDHHKAHDGSVDSFELADSFIALMAHPASEPKALTRQKLHTLLIRHAVSFAEWDDGSLEYVNFGQYGFEAFFNALLADRGS